MTGFRILLKRRVSLRENLGDRWTFDVLVLIATHVEIVVLRKFDGGTVGYECDRLL